MRLNLPLHITRSLRRVENGKPSPESDQLTYKFLLEGEIDYVVVVGSGLMIPTGLIDVAGTRYVNMHPSLLPAWRGPAPVPRAIAAGEEKTGVTIHFITPKTDRGPILLQEKIPIRPYDDAETVTRRAFETGTNLLLDALRLLVDGKAKPKEQPEEDPQGRLAEQITEAEKRLLWPLMTAEQVVNHVRAFVGPQSGCITRYGGWSLQVRAATHVPREHDAAMGDPGKIVAVHPKSGVTVLASDREPVLLTRLSYGARKRRSKTEPPLAQILMETQIREGGYLR